MSLDTVLNRPLTPSELAQWPLVHGCLLLDDVVDAIRSEGLRAPGFSGRAANSFDYDRDLGRTESVFLSPFGLRGDYGLGNVILVDPVVLSLPGVRCALHDIGEVIRQVGRLADDSRYQFPGWLLMPDVLMALVEEHRQRVEQSPESFDVPVDIRAWWVAERTVQSVQASRKFRDYADGYLLEPGVFLATLVACYPDGTSLRSFLERERNKFDLEVLVPQAVRPEHLLGYRSNGVWHPWKGPESREAAERLGDLIALWSRSRTSL